MAPLGGDGIPRRRWHPSAATAFLGGNGGDGISWWRQHPLAAWWRWHPSVAMASLGGDGIPWRRRQGVRLARQHASHQPSRQTKPTAKVSARHRSAAPVSNPPPATIPGPAHREVTLSPRTPAPGTRDVCWRRSTELPCCLWTPRPWKRSCSACDFTRRRTALPILLLEPRSANGEELPPRQKNPAGFSLRITDSAFQATHSKNRSCLLPSRALQQLERGRCSRRHRTNCPRSTESKVTLFNRIAV